MFTIHVVKVKYIFGVLCTVGDPLVYSGLHKKNMELRLSVCICDITHISNSVHAPVIAVGTQ
jgi:hypothetical protein